MRDGSSGYHEADQGYFHEQNDRAETGGRFRSVLRIEGDRRRNEGTGLYLGELSPQTGAVSAFQFL